jgi:hypothetical protein
LLKYYQDLKKNPDLRPFITKGGLDVDKAEKYKNELKGKIDKAIVKTSEQIENIEELDVNNERMSFIEGLSNPNYSNDNKITFNFGRKIFTTNKMEDIVKMGVELKMDTSKVKLILALGLNKLVGGKAGKINSISDDVITYYRNLKEDFKRDINLKQYVGGFGDGLKTDKVEALKDSLISELGAEKSRLEKIASTATIPTPIISLQEYINKRESSKSEKRNNKNRDLIKVDTKQSINSEFLKKAIQEQNNLKQQKKNVTPRIKEIIDSGATEDEITNQIAAYAYRETLSGKFGSHVSSINLRELLQRKGEEYGGNIIIVHGLSNNGQILRTSRVIEKIEYIFDEQDKIFDGEYGFVSSPFVAEKNKQKALDVMRKEIKYIEEQQRQYQRTLKK